MYKRDITQLAIYQVEEDVESISLECLQELYIEKTSDIVYITKEGKLYAIVCLSDILHNCQGNKVMVNRSFTFLMGYNAVKASMIFRTKRNINKIPVVNEQGELLGDYSRWNELFYIEYNPKCIMRIERTRLINVLKHYRKIYVVEPAKSIQYGYMHLMHTHRFTAEESKNNIMKIYQEVMGDILRHKGIAVVRIPRLTMKGEEISSVRIQRYMEEKEYEKVFMLVPESTKQYLV